MCELHNKLTTPVGQNYVVLSIVSPAHQKNDTLAVVVRGIFETAEEAKQFAEDQNDGKFDIFIVEAGHWFPLPPDYDRINDVKYTDDRLQMLMDAHRAEQERAKSAIQSRIGEAASSSDSNA
jgi:Family of unknown function (DUF5832)